MSDELKRWATEAAIALRAATKIGQRSCDEDDHLSYGNHDRLLAKLEEIDLVERPLLTTSERRALDLTISLVNEIADGVVADGPTRDQDMREIVAHVHAIQQAIMAQAAARAYPDELRLLGGTT